ncbi:hypothetical protein X943_003112 [Babesia divergens]|uniref:Uncharacterized protein n=1 Tax=Babesia divergens TaxID=32595 RepID=A0AAD9G7K4_BABDI|nr:hypothetical protein X943_003112 [Babesia divergens]
MLLFEGSVDDFLGGVRRATSRRTAEKLYKRLVKNGTSVNIASDENLPGSRVLVGELLLHGFVEQIASFGSAENLLKRFHELCLHPLALDQPLLSYATPYITAPIPFEPVNRTESEHNCYEQYGEASKDAVSSLTKSNSEKSNVCDLPGVSESGEQSQTSVSTDSKRDQMDEQPPYSYGEAFVYREDISNATASISAKLGDTVSIGSSTSVIPDQWIGDITFAQSPKSIIERMRWTAVDVCVWERQTLQKSPPINSSTLWNSKLANVSTIIASLGTIVDTTQCKTCAEILDVLRTSFTSNLIYILKRTKRPDEVAMFHGKLFQDIAQWYHNCDVIMAAFYTHIGKVIDCRLEVDAQDQKEAINRMGLAMAGWLTDKRIHYYIDTLTNIEVYQTIFRAFMKLVPCNDNYHLETEHLTLFRDAFVAFLLNSAVYMIDDVCEASKIGFDPYVPRGINYCYRLNSGLHVLSCMIEHYIRAIASLAPMVDETGTQIFHTVAAPLLGNENLYKWLHGVKFKAWNGEEQLMQCRLAVVVLYLVAVNYQQPFLRSEDIKFISKFHGLPWVSALAFCCRDPVSNHMVGPLTTILVQSLGEGILLNLAMGDTTITVMDEVISDVKQDALDIYGHKAVKLSLMEPVERTSVYALLRIMWPKILAKLLSHNVRRMAISPMIYYAITHMMPVIWGKELQNEMTDANQEHLKNKFKCDSTQLHLDFHWVLHLINQMYCMEPTLCDVAMVDAIIYHFGLGKPPTPMSKVKDALMLFNHDPRYTEIQAEIASNYIALHQNPINMLLRMTEKAALNAFVLRPFSNIILQLLHSLYKDICYGFPTFNMQRKTQLDVTDINALQEAAILNVVMELADDIPPRSIEINMSSFISVLTARATFKDEIVSATGLPIHPLLAYVELGVPEEMSFDKLTENFTYSVEALCKSAVTSTKGNVEYTSISKQRGIPKASLKPYSAGDVATYHLYQVLLQVLEMPELSQISTNVTEDPNVQRFMMIIQVYWRCLQLSSTNGAFLEFIRNSLFIVLQIHYLCPWMVNKSTEQLQMWLHTERNLEAGLQEFAR